MVIDKLVIPAIVLWFFMVLTVWWSLCTTRAFAQREHIRAYVMSMPGSGTDWHAALRAYQVIRYSSHIWALMIFRDPRHLYGPLLAPAFPNKFEVLNGTGRHIPN